MKKYDWMQDLGSHPKIWVDQMSMYMKKKQVTNLHTKKNQQPKNTFKTTNKQKKQQNFHWVVDTDKPSPHTHNM